MTFCHSPASVTLCMLAMLVPAIAQSETARHHDAHVHGHAELLIVQEGLQLDIELISPAINLLGFEHQAKSQAERHTVRRVKALFANANSLFQLTPADCQPKEYQQNFDSLIHSHEQNKSDQHAYNHNNIHIEYRYSCEQTVKLHAVESSIFSAFPALEQLEVLWIVNGRQGAAILDNSQRLLNFR